jgi:hypothetical protein
MRSCLGIGLTEISSDDTRASTAFNVDGRQEKNQQNRHLNYVSRRCDNSTQRWSAFPVLAVETATQRTGTYPA